MSSSPITSFAVLGVGEIGVPIVEELLAHGHDVRIFTRPGSKNTSISSLQKKGAKRMEVDYTSDTSIEIALQGGVDVVISTIGHTEDDVQLKVARVAKRLGVKLFVPSMWGFDYASPKVMDPATVNPAVAEKVALLARLDELQLPWIGISNGLFASWSLTPLFGINLVKQEVDLKVQGEQELSFSHLSDIAAFLRTVVTTQKLPTPGQGQWYYVESYKSSFNEVLREAQRLDGPEKPWRITQMPVIEFRLRQQKESDYGKLFWVSSSVSDGRALRMENDNSKIGFTPHYNLRSSIRELLKKTRQV